MKQSIEIRDLVGKLDIEAEEQYAYNWNWNGIRIKTLTVAYKSIYDLIVTIDLSNGDFISFIYYKNKDRFLIPRLIINGIDMTSSLNSIRDIDMKSLIKDIISFYKKFKDSSTKMETFLVVFKESIYLDGISLNVDETEILKKIKDLGIKIINTTYFEDIYTSNKFSFILKCEESKLKLLEKFIDFYEVYNKDHALKFGLCDDLQKDLEALKDAKDNNNSIVLLNEIKEKIKALEEIIIKNK